MTTDAHDQEHPVTAPEPADPRSFVVEESYSLTPGSSSRIVERVMRASRTTSLIDHLAEDERAWADHLSAADRERLTTYLAAHPEKAPAHLAAHLTDVGILARPGPTSVTGDAQSNPTEQEKP